MRVLLLDDDAWTEYVVSTVLRKRGHEVRVARTAEQALKLGAEATPDVVITEAVLQSADDGEAAHGSAILAKLRRLVAPVEPAVLALTALPVTDEHVRAIGHDGYLGKPFRFADLDRAVERAADARRRRLAQQLGPEPIQSPPMGSGIQGTLDQLSLGSLLTMIEMERKSGILLLRRGTLSARLYCREGRVVAARLFGTNPLSGVDVVYKLLAWTDGHFNFTAMPVTVSDEIGLRTTHLLLEGARRNDEAVQGGA